MQIFIFYLYILSFAKDVFFPPNSVTKSQQQSLLDSSPPHLVSALGSPCESDGAFVARLHAASAGLHTEALRLQRRHVVPVKLTAL